MNARKLKEKPLVEAIFELRWKLKPINGELLKDPAYDLLPGQIYSKIKVDYPYHVALSQVSIPDEISSYVVKHQFRVAKDGWPLVQLGPGIISVNDTKSYSWDDFGKRIEEYVRLLHLTYSESGTELEPIKVLLRYINAVKFRFETNNILDFLKNNLKVDISFDPNLFAGDKVSPIPFGNDLRFVFNVKEPVGVMLLRFVRGVSNGVDSLIWELQLESGVSNLPRNPDEILRWADGAHSVLESLFFEMIKGNLSERYK